MVSEACHVHACWDSAGFLFYNQRSMVKPACGTRGAIHRQQNPGLKECMVQRTQTAMSQTLARPASPVLPMQATLKIWSIADPKCLCTGHKGCSILACHRLEGQQQPQAIALIGPLKKFLVDS